MLEESYEEIEFFLGIFMFPNLFRLFVHFFSLIDERICTILIDENVCDVFALHLTFMMF